MVPIIINIAQGKKGKKEYLYSIEAYFNVYEIKNS
jgi:hypothetical protein